MALKKTKTTALPTSKARTAYGLLNDVRKLILAEPKRYSQERFIARVGGKNGADDLVKNSILYRAVPTCGTVGCVAGWVATLKRGDDFTYLQAQPIATEALGLTVRQAWELFNGAALSGEVIPAMPQCQTPAYARLGAKHIANFQKKYAGQLKAKRV